jgi:hypothetical protein
MVALASSFHPAWVWNLIFRDRQRGRGSLLLFHRILFLLDLFLVLPKACQPVWRTGFVWMAVQPSVAVFCTEGHILSLFVY